jgi:hypothetical protein
MLAEEVIENLEVGVESFTQILVLGIDQWKIRHKYKAN